MLARSTRIELRIKRRLIVDRNEDDCHFVVQVTATLIDGLIILPGLSS